MTFTTQSHETAASLKKHLLLHLFHNNYNAFRDAIEENKHNPIFNVQDVIYDIMYGSDDYAIPYIYHAVKNYTNKGDVKLMAFFLAHGFDFQELQEELSTHMHYETRDDLDDVLTKIEQAFNNYRYMS